MISRQLVEAWYRRSNRNKAGDTPPEPVTVDDDAPRTAPTVRFVIVAWVDWVAPGVRGWRRRGWVIPVRRQP